MPCSGKQKDRHAVKRLTADCEALPYLLGQARLLGIVTTCAAGLLSSIYALTGRVLAVKAETENDIHVALEDATGDKPGIVIVEVLAEPQ
jgi:hypothetical protein